MKLPLIEVFEEAPEVRRLRFGLEKPMNQKPGQFIMIAFEVDDLENPGKRKIVKRAYSLCSSPVDGEFIEICFNRVPDGFISKILYDVPKGSDLEVTGPYGHFTYTEGQSNNVLLLCAGLGITPMRAIARFIVDKQLPASLTLLYGVRKPENIVFHTEMEELMKKYANFKAHFTISRPEGTTWKGDTGRVNKEYILKYAPDIKEKLTYICGPPEFVKDMIRTLKDDLQVPATQIKTEAW